MNDKAIRRHYLFRCLVLGGFSLVLAKLLFTGSINYYLAPRLQTLCYVTLGILVFLSVISLVQAIRGISDDACDCGGVHTLPSGFWKNILIYSLFLLPVAMGLFLPDKVLGNEVAQQKGMNLLKGDAKTVLSANKESGKTAPAPSAGTNNPDSIRLADPDPASLEPSMGPDLPDTASTSDPDPASPQPVENAAGKPKDDAELEQMFLDAGFGDFYNKTAIAMYKQPVIDLNDKIFLDGLTILDLFYQEFNGHQLEMTGFVYRQPSLSEDEFVAARFSVSCCAADAVVSGILIQSPQAKKYPTDSWVHVKGTLRITTYEGNDLLVLQADEITPV
jgi:uncharacterized repeat protein (TIGR03943 family)